MQLILHMYAHIYEGVVKVRIIDGYGESKGKGGRISGSSLGTRWQHKNNPNANGNPNPNVISAPGAESSNAEYVNDTCDLGWQASSANSGGAY